MVEKSYPGKPALGFCQYHVTDFPPDVLESVLAAHKMHLLEPEKSVHTSLSLGFNDHVAEIVVDPSIPKPIFNYVVQHRYSRDVVDWGTKPNFQAANRQIERMDVDGFQPSELNHDLFALAKAMRLCSPLLDPSRVHFKTLFCPNLHDTLISKRVSG